MRYLFRKKRLHLLAAAFDAVAPLARLALPRRHSTSKHVLIVRLDHLGDVLPATALPQLLKERWGASRVTFLTSSAGRALLENNPFVDEVLVYDAPWFVRQASGPKDAGFWRTCARLSAIRPDLALLPRGDVRENILAWAARIPERVGYGVTGGAALLTRCLEYRFGSHESRHTLDLARAIGVHAESLVPAIHFSNEEERRFEQRSREWGAPAGGYIALQLDAGTAAKRWPAENVDAFLELLSQRPLSVPLVFLGQDTALAGRIAARAASKMLPWKALAGRTTVREMLWLAGHAKAFVGHDSGPTHAAAAMGVPSLFLYSGTNRWQEWRPLAESAEALRHPVPCSPCHLTHCPVPGHPCMAGIEPAKVVDWMRRRADG